MPIEETYAVYKVSAPNGHARWYLRDNTDVPYPVKEFDHYPSEEEIETAISMKRVM